MKKKVSGSARTEEGSAQPQLECGQQVACFLQKYEEEEPQIGTVTAIPAGRKSVEIEWMVGSYSQPWTVYKRREGGKYVAWKEMIPPSSILFAIDLTRSSRLSPGLVKKLKRAYKEVKEAA